MSKDIPTAKLIWLAAAASLPLVLLGGCVVAPAYPDGRYYHQDAVYGEPGAVYAAPDVYVAPAPYVYYGGGGYWHGRYWHGGGR